MNISLEGTQLAGTIGPRRCSLIWPMVGAMLGIPFLIWRADSSPSFNIVALFSSCVFEWKIEWDVDYFRARFVAEKLSSKSSSESGKHFRQTKIKSFLLFSLGMIVFALIFSSSIYQNLHVETNGGKLKIKDVLRDFIKGREFHRVYRPILNILEELWLFYKQYGFTGLWKEIWALIDSESDKEAFYVCLRIR